MFVPCQLIDAQIYSTKYAPTCMRAYCSLVNLSGWWMLVNDS